MIVHELSGCAPAPLAHYLKALGVLRLVSEQADAQARGWWEGERFFLATVLEHDELARFFLDLYRPTPLVSPWNKGAGFFQSNDPGLTPLERSVAPRFEPMREGIAASRARLDTLASADAAVRAIKGESKGLTGTQKKTLRELPEYKARLAAAEREFKRLKADFIPGLRLSLRGPHREWIDAAMVLGEDGVPKFPALLGTGGNDGRLDFTNNYFQRLSEIFDPASESGMARFSASIWIEGALWGGAKRTAVADIAVGQFLPGQAGGANAGNGPNADSGLNPFDFVLMMEGTVTMTAHATKRFGGHQVSRAAAPFAISGQGAAYLSASETDESPRGEQSMPLWDAPLTYVELRRLLAEGRAQIGGKPAQEPLDLARAVARLGVARGVSAFQRYGYIERNGQSNLAVPLGRFRVPDQVSPRLACLDDLDGWLARLRRAARDKGAPARLRLAERRLIDALFALVQHPDEAARWQAVLVALAGTEALMVTGCGFNAGPVPRLRPEWVAAADDGSCELRLALACAMQARALDRHALRGQDGIRRHWLPLDEKSYSPRFASSGAGAQRRLRQASDVVMRGRSGADDAIALVRRRLIESAQRGERRLPLVAAVKAAASPSDLARLIRGAVDLDRTMTLALALMALDAREWARRPCPPQSSSAIEEPDDTWMTLRLALLPWPLADGRRIPLDPAIFRRLESGDAATALQLARRRLQAAGIQSCVRATSLPADTARRWAAAMAFPISQHTASRFARLVDPNAPSETRHVA